MNEILKAISPSGKISIALCNIRELCEKARVIHDLYPTSLAALGRVMAVNAIMASNLKGEEESVTTTINGNGPIGTILVTAQSNGHIKGFVGDNKLYMKYNDNGKLAVGKAVGNDGYLKVTKDLRLKDRFTGQVALQSGEIGEDFAYYFALSEQIPSLVSVGVLVDVDYSCKAAGAMIAQLMPGHDEEDIAYLEDVQKRLRPISSLLNEGLSLKEILESYFPQAEILETASCDYVCDCNRERFIRGLFTLPLDDLKDLAKDDIEVKCEFCNKLYHFKKAEVEAWIKDVENQRSAY